MVRGFNNRSIKIDVLFIALVYFTGFLGINYLDSSYSSVFIKTSFVSILIPLCFYFIRTKPSSEEYLILLLVYFMTFVLECLGVNYGCLFGNYHYGESLGLKIFGVPLLIGANWLLLALTARQVIGNWIKNRWLIMLGASLLMVLIDVVIEPVATKLDFWDWENNIIPLSNYRDWFIIGFIGQLLLVKFQLNKLMFKWSLSYLFLLAVFFLSFYI